MIDKTSVIPVYVQLKSIILENIKNEFWKEGQLISSERELAEQFSISRMTVRQALGELVQEEYLYKKKGKGTYVCKQKVTQQDIMSFTEMIEKTGGILENVILSFDLIDTPENLISIFEENKLYKINRNRIVDGSVIANEVIYMPEIIASKLKTIDLKGSIYKYLESLNRHVSYCKSSINAVLYDKNYQKLFKLESKVPLLSVSNKVYDADDNLLFFEEAIYRSDKYTLEVNISKREGKLQ
ncbi:MAG: GntR family transcriptional regulator [Sarcina sp.]